jgi:hypothetical protein
MPQIVVTSSGEIWGSGRRKLRQPHSTPQTMQSKVNSQHESVSNSSKMMPVLDPQAEGTKEVIVCVNIKKYSA